MSTSERNGRTRMNTLRWLYIAPCWNVQGATELDRRYQEDFAERATVTMDGQVLMVDLMRRGCGNLVPFSVAWQEARRVRQMAACGHSPADLLAIAVVSTIKNFGRAFTVKRQIAGTMPLAEFIGNTWKKLSRRHRASALCRFAHFLRQLHDGGVYLDFAELKGVLVAQAATTPCFMVGGELPLSFWGTGRRPRDTSLISLLAVFIHRLRLVEKVLFLKTYCEAAPKQDDWRQMFRFLARTGLGRCRRIWHRQSRQSIHSNSRFVREKRGKFNVFRVRRPHMEKVLATLLPDPDRSFEHGRIVKPGDRTHCGFVELGGREYFLKRYNPGGWWQRLANSLRRSRARRAWLLNWELILRNLPVPEPLLCLEERRFGILQRGYVLMEAVENPRTLWHWPNLSDAEQDACLQNLGKVIGSLHASSMIHGDLKWNNILLNQQEFGRIRLVDFDGSRSFRRPNSKRMWKDLQRFFRDFQSFPELVAKREQFFDSWLRWAMPGDLKRQKHAFWRNNDET